MTLRLHNFFRSSTSTRLRIALNLKGLEYDYLAYSLRDGQHRTPAFLARNPAGLVPVLELDDGAHLTQSLAIIEWLDATHPAPPLLPPAPLDQARVRAMAYMIACEIHPLNNLRVLNYLSGPLGLSEVQVADWFRHWVAETFAPLEVLLAARPPGPFCWGHQPGLADICLYAQVWNNRRFAVDMEPYPTIAAIFTALDGIAAFRDAAPPAQPDATG